MLTREEQIAALEKHLNRLLVHLAENQERMDGYNHGPFMKVEWAESLSAVTDALVYLRGMPNPRGVHEIRRPKRNLRMTDD